MVLGETNALMSRAEDEFSEMDVKAGEEGCRRGRRSPPFY